MAATDFLTAGDVLAIHEDQLARYGGQAGILDRNIVESAAAQAQQTMFGAYLHADLAMMAAAYLFHYAAAQGFVDGNKRTAAACAVIFLVRNGYDLDCTDEELYELTIRAATRRIAKEEIGEWVRERLVAMTS